MYILNYPEQSGCFPPLEIRPRKSITAQEGNQFTPSTFGSQLQFVYVQKTIGSTMASTRRCVISLKRQHMETDEIEHDIKLTSSMLAKLDADMEKAKSKAETSEYSTQKENSNASDSDAESDTQDARRRNVSIADDSYKRAQTSAAEVPVLERESSSVPVAADTITLEKSAKEIVPQEVGETAPEERSDTVPEELRETVPEKVVAARTDSPRPGPSYEDITFEPLRTSTPLHDNSGNAEDVPHEYLSVREIKNDVRNGQMLISQVNFEFMQDIRQTLQNQSRKYITKLTSRRIEISKRMASLKKQRNTIDNMLTLLNSQREDLDDTLHKINYFIENFPY